MGGLFRMFEGIDLFEAIANKQIENAGLNEDKRKEIAINAYPNAYKEAYQMGMKYPIGHSMSAPEGLAEFNKKPYARRRTRGGGFGKFSFGGLTTVKDVAAEIAWNEGWNRAVEEQKKRLNQFNVFDRAYQGRK